MDQKSRNHCFTINNTHDVDAVGTMLQSKKALYYVIGKEIAPSTGTNHLQGYVHWPSGRTLRAVIKYWNGWHVEECKGSPAQNVDYCKKSGDFIEFGTPPSPGKRNDLSDLVKAVRIDNKPMNELIDTGIVSNFQQIKFAETLLKYNKLDKSIRSLEVHWFYGETGAGKSRAAIDSVTNGDFWISGRNLKWFDGYYGQSDVIIDDFRKDFCTFHELLRLLDIYPMRVETKGSSCMWIPKRIYITSCFHPEEVYETREDIHQLLRRITSIKKFEVQGFKDQRSGGNTEPPTKHANIVDFLLS